MEIKLFGKSLFEFNQNKSMVLTEPAIAKVKESKFLPDFKNFEASRTSQGIAEFVVFENPSGGAVAVPKGKKPEKRAGKAKMVYGITPKGVYEMKMLDSQGFQLNTNPDYVDTQIADFKEKLNLIKSEEYDMRRGVEEIGSVLLRLENRKKYPEVKDFFEQYPYTTTSRIEGITKAHDYLRLGQIAEFLADMPNEATQVMSAYNEHTKIVCDKQAVYYILADKKDFERTNKRRDPILLAQSPFGHFWQILGAWDKEMLLLEEL